MSGGGSGGGGGHRIRPADAADAPRIAAIYAPYVTGGTISFETEPPGAAAIAARMTRPDGSGDGDLAEGPPWLVADDAAGIVAGYAYARPFDARDAYRRSVETTIYLADDACGQGLGRHLYGTLLEAVAALGYTQAVGRISMPNDPSVALHAALGFRRAGRLEAIGWKAGRFVDVELWQRGLLSGFRSAGSSVARFTGGTQPDRKPF